MFVASVGSLPDPQPPVQFEAERLGKAGLDEHHVAVTTASGRSGHAVTTARSPLSAWIVSHAIPPKVLNIHLPGIGVAIDDRAASHGLPPLRRGARNQRMDAVRC